MQIFKVILHTHGGYPYIDSGANYPIDGRQALAKGFGVNPYDAKIAAMQFKKTAEFFNNQYKTPLFHYITSYTPETAPTPEEAMELTQQIFAPLTENHQALMGIHNEEQGNSLNHAHTFMSPTNYNDGSMIYGDNSTNYALAQRMADITGQPTELIVRKENGKEWKCPKIFVPQTDEDE